MHNVSDTNDSLERLMSLPTAFCWTRFGTESGEIPADIFRRKERERVANQGVFLWGIGNALGPSIRILLTRERCPEVIFSPIASPARIDDIAPDTVFRWTRGRTLTGDVIELPSGSMVTSRGNLDRTKPPKRYALVCSSSQPVRQMPLGFISMNRLSNMVSGAPIGASQVTAIVAKNDGIDQQENGANSGRKYPIAYRAKLEPPYFVQLLEPILVVRHAAKRKLSLRS
jgi:hypothetical protein